MSKITKIATSLLMALLITACGGGGSDIKEASNHPPSATTQSVSVKENSINNIITLTGSDIDGDLLSYTVVEQASHGSLKGTPPNLSYTPDKGFKGNDSITFKVNDGESDSELAAISIIISTLLLDPDPLHFINAGNDQSAIEGSTITLSSTNTDPSRIIISWVWRENGTILSNQESFTKNDFSLGVHTITLTVADSKGESSNDTIIITINQTSAEHAVSNKAEAAKFLNRASFGPTNDSINELVALGDYEKWLNNQFNTPATFHLPKVKQLAKKMCIGKDDDGNPIVDTWEAVYPRHQIWWETAIAGDDQLRQRVALALSEILVVSDSEGLGLSELQFGVTSYYDILVKHSFGNFRDLLEEMTLHPAMGDFLSMTRNQKANEAGTIRPDENYARELLQLFSIGVHELNLDGSEKSDSNNRSIPTYNQKTIEEFAKVFTGWSYAGEDWYVYFGEADHTIPLEAVEEFHDTSAKLLLNGAQSPAGQTAQADLIFALDNIFNHPNVAPFISKQLIQRLVTSNPTPQYIERIATIFNDNGDGVRGDLKAVVNAILLDDEALNPSKADNFGKLKEPMLRLSHLWRVFNMQKSLKAGHYWESDRTCGQGNYEYYNFWLALNEFNSRTGQGPLQARSVFNFFRPDYSPTGKLNDSGLSAPEFQIVNENTLVATTNLFHLMVEVFSDSEPFTPALGELSRLDLGAVTNMAADTDQLLDYLDLVLLNNGMTTEIRNILAEHLNIEDTYSEGREGQFEKAKEAILLIITSSEYLIQR
ncbi:MAG: DUF1800 family protein [Cocleimonas sp.]